MVGFSCVDLLFVVGRAGLVTSFAVVLWFYIYGRYFVVTVVVYGLV